MLYIGVFTLKVKRKLVIGIGITNVSYNRFALYHTNRRGDTSALKQIA